MTDAIAPRRQGTVALIPARGGSKSIPRKNVLDFCGHPLIAWTIAAARRARQIDTVYVSTDDAEIAGVARDYGARVIDRPPALSGDLASSDSAVLHGLDAVVSQTGSEPSQVVFLQPTSPLRETAELDEALDLFAREQFDSLFSGAQPEDLCLWKQDGTTLDSLNYDYRNRRRRQDAADHVTLWVETGSFYVTTAALLRASGNRLGGRIGIYPVPFWKSFEIDSQEGLDVCRTLMRVYKLDQRDPRD